MLAALAAGLAVSCAAPIEQFYPDTCYAQDNVYNNPALGFALVYAPGWQVVCDPGDMDRAQRSAASMLHAQKAELLYAGQTREGGQGTRAIAENLNRTNEEYLATVRGLNVYSIEQDLGAVVFAGGSVPMVKWEYVHAGLRYVEFLFRAGTCNVRVAFWTTPDRYSEFLPVYEQIMGTLSLRPGM